MEVTPPFCENCDITIWSVGKVPGLYYADDGKLLNEDPIKFGGVFKR